MKLITDITANGETVDFTVYEDTDNDGTAENSETVTNIGGGTTETDLTTLDFNTGNDYWVEIELNTSSISNAPVVNSIEIKGDAPTVSVDAHDATSIDISWTDTGASGYDVYRAQSSGSTTSDYTKIADTTSQSYSDTGLENGEQYFYVVTNDGSSVLSNEVSQVADLPAPDSFSLSLQAGNDIELNWTNNDSSPDGTIEILRSTDGSTGSSVQSFSDVSTNTYTDTGLLDGERYYYTVRRSTDHADSDSSQLTTLTNLPAPDNLSVTQGANPDEIDISWDRNDNSSQGDFKLYESENGILGSEIASYATSTTSTTITGREHGELFYYTVRRNTGDATEDTSQQSITTTLPAPSGLSATGSVTDIDLSWTDNDNSSDGTLELYRSTDGSLGTVINTFGSVNTTSYTDSAVTGGPTYYYTLRRSTDHDTVDSSQVSTQTTGIVGEKTYLSWRSRSDWDDAVTMQAFTEEHFTAGADEDVTLGLSEDWDFKDELLAYHAFENSGDGTVVDRTGNGYDGTADSTLGYSNSAPHGRNSWYFDGTDDATVEFENMGVFGDTSVALVCVFNPNTDSDDSMLINFGGDDDRDQLALLVESDCQGYVIGLGQGGSFDDDSDSKSYSIGSDFSGQWNVAIVQYDADTSTIEGYHNGTNFASETLSNPMKLHNQRYRVGSGAIARPAVNPIRGYDGYISEALWFSRVLTSSEITQISDSLTTGKLTTKVRKL